MPHSINPADKELQICLIVKDVDPKDRDYEKTIRKYKQIIENENLSQLITQVELFIILKTLYICHVNNNLNIKLR